MEPIYVVVRTIVLGFLTLFRKRAVGLKKIPPSGAAILVANHISNFDPLCMAWLAHRAGRRPRFLGKASLWRNPLMRFWLNGCGQIPVERGTGEAAPTRAAEKALRRGQMVVIYPEATITTNEDLTPMRGKTGVARLALATGAPVIPVGQWGAQWLIGKGREWRYRGHRTIMFNVGDPMAFEADAVAADDPARLRAVTDRIMAEVDRLVREVQKMHPDGGAVPARKVAAR